MSVSASTRPVAAALGAAAFEEALTLRSPVYFSRGAKAVFKYKPRAFAVSVAASTLELGKHEVNLTRLLPLSFDDLEDGGESGFGKWTTSFRLSGPARGTRLNVTFSCSLLAGGGSEQHKAREVAGLRRGSMARPVSMQAPTPVPARSRDVRVLHKVLPSLRSARALPFGGDGGLHARKEEVAALDCTEKAKPWGYQTQQQSGSRWLLAAGMGKRNINKHPLMKFKAIVKPTKEAAGAGDTLWNWTLLETFLAGCEIMYIN